MGTTLLSLSSGQFDTSSEVVTYIALIW